MQSLLRIIRQRLQRQKTVPNNPDEEAPVVGNYNHQTELLPPNHNPLEMWEGVAEHVRRKDMLRQNTETPVNAC